CSTIQDSRLTQLRKKPTVQIESEYRTTMLRFALLVVLPIVSLCITASTSSREEMLKMLEEHVRPCIVDNTNCPPENDDWKFENFAPMVRQMRAHRPPPECDCDVSSESCIRPCYYAIMLNTYRKSVLNGLTDPVEIENAERQMMQLFETYYKPCILENKNCELAGGINYEQIRNQVLQMVKAYSLPDECNFEVESETAIRVCYYAFLKRSALAAFPEKK
uniref:Secreted protein n=1 Tax=Macrostomum lignano TaxID=282301 RepID=A0A1I8G9Z9_9PLAT